MKKCIIVSFEGIDGCGKTTQSKKFFNYLKNKGIDAVLLREPGGTEAGEKIREILLDKNINISKWTELFLYLASRAQLISEVIKKYPSISFFFPCKTANLPKLLLYSATLSFFVCFVASATYLSLSISDNCFSLVNPKFTCVKIINKTIVKIKFFLIINLLIIKLYSIIVNPLIIFSLSL